MTFFDRLQENDIVRENGNIVKCFDDVADGFTVSDELRKVFVIIELKNLESKTFHEI